MKFLNNIKSLAELKTNYKTLARKLHPDMGGNEADMQTLNAEFEMLFTVWKNADKNSVSYVDGETARGFTSKFYTSNGWEGSRYDVNLYNKDIAKKIKEFCKCVYPNCKFSITSSYDSINVSLMEADYNVFTTSEKYVQVNHYYIERDFRLTEKCRIMLENIKEYMYSYRYDDSDAQIDYFCTNFYPHMTVGKWNTPFKVVEKISRIADKSPTAKQNTISEKNAENPIAEYNYEVREDTDTRDNSQIWVVRITTDISKEKYPTVAREMRKIGGYYSRFKHGFIFRTYPEILERK